MRENTGYECETIINLIYTPNVYASSLLRRRTSRSTPSLLHRGIVFAIYSPLFDPAAPSIILIATRTDTRVHICGAARATPLCERRSHVRAYVRMHARSRCIGLARVVSHLLFVSRFQSLWLLSHTGVRAALRSLRSFLALKWGREGKRPSQMVGERKGGNSVTFHPSSTSTFRPTSSYPSTLSPKKSGPHPLPLSSFFFLSFSFLRATREFIGVAATGRLRTLNCWETA